MQRLQGDVVLVAHLDVQYVLAVLLGRQQGIHVQELRRVVLAVNMYDPVPVVLQLDAAKVGRCVERWLASEQKCNGSLLHSTHGHGRIP